MQIKLLICLLAVCTTVTAFCGCSKNTDTSNSEPLSESSMQSTARLADKSSKAADEQGREIQESDSKESADSSSDVTYRQITQEEAAKIMQEESGYILLDVRTETEFAAGHIPGAICIPNEEITTLPPSQLPDKSQLILVYCRSGRRSKEAALKLAYMGYTNIAEFGGIITWEGEIVTD